MTWAQAFARQAESDLHVYDVLVTDPSLPACHRLHYLQMACEKLCKASGPAAGRGWSGVYHGPCDLGVSWPSLARVDLRCHGIERG